MQKGNITRGDDVLVWVSKDAFFGEILDPGREWSYAAKKSVLTAIAENTPESVDDVE